VPTQHQPSHDQERFTVKDLAVLWSPLSRSLIYKLVDELLDPKELIRITRPKIDTTKRYKRQSRRT